jgi:competence protein ComEC
MMSEAPVPLGTGASLNFVYRDPADHGDPNGNSLVTLLTLGGRRILLMGDAEGGERPRPPAPPPAVPQARSIEAVLLAGDRALITADAVVVGHHGSLTSSRSAFIEATGARIFAISSGPHPYSGVRLPDALVVGYLRTRGQVLQTNENDDLCIGSSAKIGVDDDESPGGCDSIVITVDRGAISAAYNDRPD